MTDLTTLAKHRDDLLKAELAALLHNLGKLSSNFLNSQANGSSSKFNFKSVTKPDRTVTFTYSSISSKKGVPLLNTLLNDSTLWGDAAEVARQLLENTPRSWRSGSPPTNPKTIIERLKEAIPTGSDPQQAEEIITRCYGPLALAKWFHDLDDPTWKLLDGSSDTSAGTHEQFLLDTKVCIGNEEHTLGAIISLMWDDFHERSNDLRRETLEGWIGSSTHLQRYLITVHGHVSGSEKEKVSSQGHSRQSMPPWRATVFGERHSQQDQIDSADLDTSRNALLTAFKEFHDKTQAATSAEDKVSIRKKYLPQIQDFLLKGLGDTQRPINDITLWDYVREIAALYKSALAQRVLQDSWLATDRIRWRLLAISYHGLDFWGQAHHIPDLLARREAVQQGLDAVRDLLEVTYPLGNEIYRDEHGSVFVVPDYNELLKLSDEHGQSLEQRICTAFNISDTTGVAGELQPQLYLSESYTGKHIKLAEVLKQRSRTNHVNLEQIEQAWSATMKHVNAPICTVCGVRCQPPCTCADGTIVNAPICTVCGVRPVGYAPPTINLPPWASSAKAKERNLCRVCLARRGRRAEHWVANKNNAFERTIWTDEVADQHGRLALIVGRFELDGWLDGTLIATLQKSASFARIQRCWQTTRTFWDEVEQTTIPQTVQATQPRWQIRPANAETLDLGGYHAYELDLQGRRLSVCWDPKQKVFWTTDNLAYIGKLLSEPADNRDKDPLQRLREAITGKDLAIYEPGGYGQARALKSAAKHCKIAGEPRLYAPYIPLVTEPAIFLALVPASHALAVAKAIKEKYDGEMGRVKDRLPLYLGITFAPRRTPMRALLDAGRTMREFPFAWEEWCVKEKVSAENQPHRVELTRNGQCLTWHYPATMGDGTTADRWYPYLLTKKPAPREELTFKHVKDLNDTVYIRPSRFDFTFLDTTGRRFALHYNQDGRRSDNHTRPYLLDELSRFENMWAALRLLERTQTYQIIQTIEATRALWFGNDADARSLDDPTLRQFVSDTLADAPWPDDKKWWAFDDHEREQLIAAGVRGELADLAELYFELLKQKD